MTVLLDPDVRREGARVVDAPGDRCLVQGDRERTVDDSDLDAVIAEGLRMDTRHDRA